MATQNQENKIRIANPDISENNRTYLTADVVATGTSLPVLSTTGAQFLNSGTTDYYLLVENYGIEKAELKLCDASDSGTDADSFTVAALTYGHSVSAPVTYIPYNQIRIYGLSESGATPTINSPIETIDIDPTQEFTEYNYTGNTYSIFVIAYYNSTSEAISAYSEEITTTTFSHNSVKRIIKSGLRKALTKIDENPGGVLTWDDAIEAVQDGIDEILTRKRKWSFLHSIDSNISTVAGTSYVSFPSNLVHLERIIINDILLKWVNKGEYDSYSTSSGTPYYYTIKNNKVYLYPTPSDAKAVTFEYYKNPSVLDSLTDTIDSPFVVMLTYYCAAIFAYIRNNDKRGDKMMIQFKTLLEQQVEEYTGPIQVGDAEYVERTNPIFNDNIETLL